MMLSTPHKRFVWARSDRFAEFTFFREMLQRRERVPRRKFRARAKETVADSRWKPAKWTPWLWVK